MHAIKFANVMQLMPQHCFNLFQKNKHQDVMRFWCPCTPGSHTVLETHLSFTWTTLGPFDVTPDIHLLPWCGGSVTVDTLEALWWISWVHGKGMTSFGRSSVKVTPRVIGQHWSWTRDLLHLAQGEFQGGMEGVTDLITKWLACLPTGTYHIAADCSHIAK